MRMKHKVKSREDILLRKRELRLQRVAKMRHSDMNYRLHYSTKYYRKYAPEDVERHWIEEIEKLKRLVAEYEKSISNEEENKK